jgi:hypothetical protein
MALDILKERGVPLDRQRFNWRDMVRTPISKLDDDAFTRIRSSSPRASSRRSKPRRGTSRTSVAGWPRRPRPT